MECGHRFCGMCAPVAADCRGTMPSFALLALVLTQPGLCWPSLLPGQDRLLAPAQLAAGPQPQPLPPQPGWKQEVAHPSVGINLVTFCVTFLLIDSSSQSLWMAALPSTPGMPSMSFLVIWLISSLMSVSVCACMCVCVGLEV